MNRPRSISGYPRRRAGPCSQYDERGQHRECRQDQGREPGVVARVVLHRREEDTEDAEREQPRAGQVQRAAGALRWGRGQPGPAQQERRDARRQVDQEAQPPAVRLAAEPDDQAADDGPGGRRDADRRADEAERAAALVQREQLLHDAGHLRVDQAAGQALEHPAGDEHARGRREPDDDAEDGEGADADQQHPPPAAVVAEPASDDRDHAEGQCVAGDHPLQLGRPGAGAPADRGQRDRDDADVEQRGEECGDADGERPPAPRVELGGSPGACPGRRAHPSHQAMTARVTPPLQRPPGRAGYGSAVTSRRTSSAQPQDSVKPWLPWP